MNKPSCGTCKWWASIPDEDLGACLKLRQKHRGPEEGVKAWFSSPTFLCEPDFHCAHWEDKEREDEK